MLLKLSVAADVAVLLPAMFWTLARLVLSRSTAPELSVQSRPFLLTNIAVLLQGSICCSASVTSGKGVWSRACCVPESSIAEDNRGS